MDAPPINGGINTHPLRQVQSHNCFSVLASMDDTVLEDDFIHRDYRTAYRDPESWGYRVPRILSVHSMDLPGRRNRGRRNLRNRQRRRASLSNPGETPTTLEDEPSFLRKYWNAIWSVQ